MNVRVKSLRVVAITLLLAGVARADNIDDLIDQLGNSSDRVRITAVLALTKQESPRSIDALAKTLLNRGEQKNIRGLAASALGRVVANGKPSAAQKKAAIDALTRAKGDPEPFVSAKAEAALDTIGGGSGASSVQVQATNGVYVFVGPISVSAANTDKAKMKSLIEKTAKDTLTRVEPRIKQTWPGGKIPTKQDLDTKGVAGFSIQGTFNELVVKTSGGDATVTCRISLVFATFPNPAIIGTLNGNANVQGGSRASDVELSKSDCVQAVVEDLIAKKIVPTIRSKATP